MRLGGSEAIGFELSSDAAVTQWWESSYLICVMKGRVQGWIPHSSPPSRCWDTSLLPWLFLQPLGVTPTPLLPLPPFQLKAWIC